MSKIFSFPLSSNQYSTFVNSSDSFKEIYDKLSASQPYPDFIGGSGVTKVEYWFDDKGKEKIFLRDVFIIGCSGFGCNSVLYAIIDFVGSS